MTYGEAILARHSDPSKVAYEIQKIIYERAEDSWTPGERNFALTNRLAAEVNNGGFDQYFSNGGYAEVSALLNALNVLGAGETEKLVRQAIDIVKLPDPLPDDFEYADDETIAEQLSTLDDQFYELNLEAEELEPLLVKYLKEHTAEFA